MALVHQKGREGHYVGKIKKQKDSLSKSYWEGWH
jgi:hypothetical protein